jgi:hypothetical protein
MSKFGFSALNSRVNSNSTTLGNKVGLNSEYSSLNIIAGRVTDIILDDKHPLFGKENTIGEEGWASIGNISFKNINSNGSNSSQISVAKPLHSNTKNPPLLNEIVYIFTLPDISSQNNSLPKKFYYSNIINLWNHPLHNANPFFIDTQNNNNSSNKSYDLVSNNGTPGNSDSSSNDINLGASWIQNLKINPLKQTIGDYIVEGRYGNSLKFGSNNGNPLTIIRNGQPNNSSTQTWVPIEEDINKDLSSIYLASNQKIPLKTSSNIYRSYLSSSPTLANEYSKSQIILNSERVLLNSTADHIMLSSALTINFNSIKGFNFDTSGDFILNSPKIYLGSPRATEPLLLGNKTVALLDTLLQSLSVLCTALSSIQDWPGGAPVPNSIISSVSINTQSIITNLTTQLNSLKSNTSKTI